MIGVIKLRESLHNKLLRLRSIEAMLERPGFNRLWEDSSSEQQSKLSAAVEAGDRDAVHVWMRDHPSLELGERSLTDLKRIARNLSILNYSRKGKLELIRDIKEREDGL